MYKMSLIVTKNIFIVKNGFEKKCFLRKIKKF